MQLASLPPRLVHLITWGQFVNTHGGLGHNLPCDFHNEHVNKLIKEHIKHMGSNFSQKAITNVACSVSYMKAVIGTISSVEFMQSHQHIQQGVTSMM